MPRIHISWTDLNVGFHWFKSWTVNEATDTRSEDKWFVIDLLILKVVFESRRSLSADEYARIVE